MIGVGVLVLSLSALAGQRGVVRDAPDPLGRDRAYEPRRVALVVGIDAYADPALGDLRYAVNDARDVAEVLADPAHGAFDGVSQFGGRVSRDSFWSSFRAATGSLQRDDTFLLYIAAHGTLDILSEGTRLYVLPSDAWLSHPADSGIALDEIEAAIAGLPARRRVLVLDTCYSGQGRSRVSASTEERIRGLRGPLPASVAVDASESEVRLFAAHENQPANEDSNLENGVYTYYFVEALTGAGDADGDGLVEVMEAHDWARDRTMEYTGGAQVPWVEAMQVGRESTWLAGDVSLRHRAERALVEGLEALPAGAVLTVDGIPRGGGVLEPGPRSLEVVVGGQTVIDRRIHARPGRRIDLGGLVEERQGQVILQAGVAWNPPQEWIPSWAPELQLWWMPADPGGFRAIWGASAGLGLGEIGDLGSFPTGHAFASGGAMVGGRLVAGPFLGLGGIWRVPDPTLLQAAPAAVPGLHVHLAFGPAVVSVDGSIVAFIVEEGTSFFPRGAASLGARF